jgi:hypothetical protein
MAFGFVFGSVHRSTAQGGEADNGESPPESLYIMVNEINMREVIIHKYIDDALLRRK